MFGVFECHSFSLLGKGRERFLYAQNPHFSGRICLFSACQENNSGVTTDKEDGHLGWHPWCCSIPALWDLLSKVLHLFLVLEGKGLSFFPQFRDASWWFLYSLLCFAKPTTFQLVSLSLCLQQPFPFSSNALNVLIPFWGRNCKHRSLALFYHNLVIVALTHHSTQVMDSPKAQEKSSQPPVQHSAGHCTRRHNECFMSSFLLSVSVSLPLNDHLYKTHWHMPVKKISGKGGKDWLAVLGGARCYLKWV